mgnify:FL=1
MASTLVRIKRIYEPAVKGDGYRILVDRVDQPYPLTQ